MALTALLILAAALLGRYEEFLIVPFLLSVFLIISFRTKLRFDSIGFCLLLLGIITFLYLLPLPSSLLPQRTEYHEVADEVIFEIDSIVGQNSHQNKVNWLPLSLNKSGTLRYLMFLIILLGLWFASSSVFFRKEGDPHERLLHDKKLLWFLHLALLFFSSAGLVSVFLFPQGDSILWLFPVLNGDPVGLFVNPNHFAFSNLLLITTSFTLARSGPITPRDPLLKNFANTKHKVIIAVSFSVAIVAIVASSSRGAIVAMIAGFLAYAAYTFLGQALQGFVLPAVALILTIWAAIFISESGGLQLRDKLESLKDPLSSNSAATRVHSWKDSAEILESFSLFGIGPEGFRSVYPMFQTLNSRKHHVYAENEFVQAVVEFGILGSFTILAGTIFSCFYFPRAKKYLNSSGVSRGSAPLTFLITASLVHCLVDFPLRHPFNAIIWLLTFMILTRTEGANVMTNSRHKIYLQRFCVGFVSLAAVFYLATTFILQINQQKIQTRETSKESLLAIFVSPIILDDYDDFQNASLQQLCNSLQSSPTSPAVWKQIGLRLIDYSNHPDISLVTAAKASELALNCLQQACLYNPNNYRNWILLSMVEHRLGYTARATESFLKAKTLRPYLDRPF